MKNFIQPGNAITIASSPAAVQSGDPLLVGALFGVCSGDAALGDPVVLSTVGVYTLSKATTDAITVGAALYFDAANGVVTLDGEGNPQIGHAVTAAAEGSATVAVRLSV